jgi:molybdopterin converting factor small subunit
MAVAFYIPSYLRTFTEGRARVSLPSSPSTVKAALDELWARYPGVRDRVVDEQGTLRQHVNVFVGEDNIRDMAGFATVVREGAEISIIPAVSGG